MLIIRSDFLALFAAKVYILRNAQMTCYDL
jgi:hypothetical protein